MRPMTPSGSRTEKFSGPALGDRVPLHLGDEASEELDLCSRHLGVARSSRTTGLPQSAESIMASSPAFSRSTRATRLSTRARSSGGTRRHSLKASLAAFTAASISSAPQSAALPSDFAGARIGLLDVAASLGLVPLAAVVGPAVSGRFSGSALTDLSGNSGIHGGCLLCAELVVGSIVRPAVPRRARARRLAARSWTNCTLPRT